MYNPIYIEMLVFCICICVILLFKVRSVSTNNINASLLTILMAFCALLNILDCVCVVSRNFQWPLTNLIFNGIYYVVGLFLTYIWLMYANRVFAFKCWKKKWMKILFSIPFVVCLCLNIASFWTGWMFTHDSNYFYLRGPFFGLQMGVCLFYVVIPFVISVSRIFIKKYYVERNVNIALSAFGVFPMLMMFVQSQFKDIPAIPVGLTLAVLLIFLSIQAEMISSDSLTGLNNRTRLNRYLADSLANEQSKSSTYLFLLDIDKFKDINYTYGPMEGDWILQMVANTLKTICGSRGFFLARFSGDVFAVVAEVNEKSEIEALRKEINLHLSKKAEHLKYVLRLNFGYTGLDVENDSVPDIISRAGKNLSTDKRNNVT